LIEGDCHVRGVLASGLITEEDAKAVH